MEWIKDITGYIPRKESIMALNDHNYGKLATKYADRNILILFCKPSDPKCQKIIAGYLVAADVFRVFFLFVFLFYHLDNQECIICLCRLFFIS